MIDNEHLNLILQKCDKINTFQLHINDGKFKKSGNILFNITEVLVEQNTENKSILRLFTKSSMEPEKWSWAFIDYEKINNQKNCAIYISDILWLELKNNEVKIFPSVYLSNKEILNKLSIQLNYTSSLIDDLISVTTDKKGLLEKVLLVPLIYFNLATEIKNKQSEFFEVILKTCEENINLLKEFNNFILHDTNDFDLTLEIKLDMSNQIDKFILKKNLEKNLNIKEIKKNKKI